MADLASAPGRTRLAWERTRLSLAVNALLLATAALHRREGLVVVPVALALIAAALAIRGTEGPAAPERLRMLAGLTVATAAFAAAVVALPFP